MSAEHAGTIMPIIYVDSVDAMRQFYVEKLGFGHLMGMLGKDGKFDFCTVTLDGARIMLTRPPAGIEGMEPAKARPVTIYLQVAKVNAYHDRLRKAGVKVTEPLTDQWWGDRTFSVVDPYGYTLWFYQTVGELKPPPGAKIV